MYEYFHGDKKKKTQILDHLTLTLGLHRDTVRKLLIREYKAWISPKRHQPRRRGVKYSDRARDILANVWMLSGNACGQYLVHQIRDGLLERLIEHKELHIGVKNKGPLVSLREPALLEIKQMSSATIDRYLQKTRRMLEPKSLSTTRPASFALRNEIPFGKSRTPHDDPGWLSTDTVAHCGENLKGEHIWTLNSTDTVTGWTETYSIKNKSSHCVREGHEKILPRFPFKIQGINYDGGSEFINQEMIDYAAMQHYQMTRSRPYHSNDNAHVEQKNADLVRRYAFRYRYEGQEALDVLNELWHWVNIRKTYLMPNRKCIGHTKTRSGRTRGVYDFPKTPAARVLECSSVSRKQKQRIRQVMASLNDAEITRRIHVLEAKLLTFAFGKEILDYVNDTF